MHKSLCGLAAPGNVGVQGDSGRAEESQNPTFVTHLCYLRLCYLRLCYLHLCYLRLCYLRLCHLRLNFVLMKNIAHAQNVSAGDPEVVNLEAYMGATGYRVAPIVMLGATAGQAKQ